MGLKLFNKRKLKNKMDRFLKKKRWEETKEN